MYRVIIFFPIWFWSFVCKVMHLFFEVGVLLFIFLAYSLMLLQAFLDFRCSVVERRARFQLSKAQQRRHIVEVCHKKHRIYLRVCTVKCQFVMYIEYNACTYVTSRVVYNHLVESWETSLAEIGEPQDVRFGPFNQKNVLITIFRNWVN